jgi:hypothetical protein
MCALAGSFYQHVEHHPDIKAFATWAHQNSLPIVAIDNVTDSAPIESTQLPKDVCCCSDRKGPGCQSKPWRRLP